MKRIIATTLVALALGCASTNTNASDRNGNGRSEAGDAFDRVRNSSNTTEPIVKENDVERVKDNTNTNVQDPK